MKNKYSSLYNSPSKYEIAVDSLLRRRFAVHQRNRGKQAAYHRDLSAFPGQPYFDVGTYNDGSPYIYLSDGDPQNLDADNWQEILDFLAKAILRIKGAIVAVKAALAGKFNLPKYNSFRYREASVKTAFTSQDVKSMRGVPYLQFEEKKEGEILIYFSDGDPQYLWADSWQDILSWLLQMLKRAEAGLKKAKLLSKKKK